MKVGVLAVQGAVAEHQDALRRAADVLGITLDVVTVRAASDMDGLAGLVIPGGESTTISRLLRSTGVHDVVARRGGKDLAVFGTCAGMILIASRGVHDVADKDVRLLGLLDADVDRNAFGRQRDSFEATVTIDGIGDVPAVFIRAPSYTATSARVTGRVDGKVVAVEQGTVMATAFHPELTPDTRLHERFLALCQS